ncbi:MAG: hypothetical protein K2K89_02610 [Ruminococcus sp.]|nr:hypothetical protein [Ruminococcus sp.]
MKILKIIAYLYMILLPNFLLKTFGMLAKVEIFSLIMMFLVLAVLGLIAGIVINVSAMNSDSSKGFSVINLIVKLWYSCIHVTMLLFSLGMLATLIFALGSGIPIVLSIILLVFSGLCNIGNCINLYRNEKCSLSKTIILSIMGFIYGLDIIGAVIQLIVSLKKKV